MKERNNLKSCTIVPDDYYVERSADRQIQSIIDDMERPGYVLVARQMGKTNLLLHTKKVMQMSRIYSYILTLRVLPLIANGSVLNIS